VVEDAPDYTPGVIILDLKGEVSTLPPQVVWQDDFEDNIAKWDIATDGAGGTAALSTEEAMSGAKSAKIVTPVGPNKSTLIRRYTPLPKLSKVGFEIAFKLVSLTTDVYWTIMFNWDGTRYDFVIYYDSAGDALKYLDEGGSYQAFASAVELGVSHTQFHMMKLIVDLEGKKYVKCTLNNTEYSLAGKNPKESVWITEDRFYIEFKATSMDATAHNAFTDDAIVTQYEP